MENSQMKQTNSDETTTSASASTSRSNSVASSSNRTSTSLNQIAPTATNKNPKQQRSESHAGTSATATATSTASIASPINVSSTNYLSNLVNKSTVFLDSLKQQYTSLTTASGPLAATAQTPPPGAKDSPRTSIVNDIDRPAAAKQQQTGAKLAPTPNSNNNKSNVNTEKHQQHQDAMEFKQNIATQMDQQKQQQHRNDKLAGIELQQSSTKTTNLSSSEAAAAAVAATTTTSKFKCDNDHADDSSRTSTTRPTAQAAAPADQEEQDNKIDSNQSNQRRTEAARGADLQGSYKAARSEKPPLPPPPPRDLVIEPPQSLIVRPPPTMTNSNSDKQSIGSSDAIKSNFAAHSQAALSPVSSGRRHALQEHSLERDAARSVKKGSGGSIFADSTSKTASVLGAAASSSPPTSATITSTKHKRASSIKSALRHAHLGPLRPSASKRAAEKAAREAAAAAAAAAGSMMICSSSAGHQKSPNQEFHSFDRKHHHSKSSAIQQPHEGLFEPPITQRTLQRTRRRGAMQSDPRRQMSMDTIGLRQLTDEYLQNAGVKVLTAQNSTLTGPDGQRQHYSLVALNAPGCRSAAGGEARSNNGAGCGASAAVALAGGSSTVAAVAAATAPSGANSISNQAQCALEAQLYQAAKKASARFEQMQQQPAGGGGGQSSSRANSHNWHHHHNSTSQQQQPSQQSNWASMYADDSDESSGLSQVTILPGNLPWQCDVSIQCELIQAPPMFEPYETTGDILNTIAGPFRGAPTTTAATSFDSAGSGSGGGGTSFQGGAANQHHHSSHHLSATLKRGLSAISQHHLSPVAGTTAGAAQTSLNVVVGNLKKSLSNTLDVNRTNAMQQGAHQRPHLQSYLRSQDSLPAYSSLNDERDSESDQANENNGGGFINQLANRLTRQSSKKFSVSRKGLQRALSFDCRGYKRLEVGDPEQAGQQQQQTRPGQSTTSGPDASNGGLFSLSKHRPHNKSTLALHNSTAPRPYLPQSASQVDFQVPLLPYDRMQEAIVSQRLLGPPPSQPGAVSNSASASNFGSCSLDDQNVQQQQQNSAGGNNRPTARQLDANELICGDTEAQQHDDYEQLDDCETQSQSASELDSRRQSNESNWSNQTANNQQRRGSRTSSVGPSDANQQQDSHNFNNNNNNREPQHYPRTFGRVICAGGRKMTPPPRLVLNIPTIATTATSDLNGDAGPPRDDRDDDQDEDEEAETQSRPPSASVLACPPSPNVTIDSTFASALVQSPSFCLTPDGRSAQNNDNNPDGPQTMPANNQLTASDVFNKSKNFIKRPSTMMASDAMTQVAQALESSSASSRQKQQQQQQQQSMFGANSSIRRNRRQAIVPPKLATDANSSDNDGDSTTTVLDDDERPVRVGQLVDLNVDDQPDGESSKQNQEELAILSANRRKRSGGETQAHATSVQAIKRHGSQGNLATSSTPFNQVRPDSQATNADSIVSSGSSATLSAIASGRLSATGGGPALSPMSQDGNSLSVPFGGGATRRRSSIAVIPQMQICPGDLLVYSKQLIDRMNQSDEVDAPPQFLTIDDKKAKNNIWSSFKLCAQFDNRTMRARNELLCSLEDVLASLQPSTFVDEQLSHYKGMIWSEFLYETESRRSASSEGLNSACADDNDDDQYDENQPNNADQKQPNRSYKEDLDCLNMSTSTQQATSQSSLSKDSAAAAPPSVSPGKTHQRSGSMKSALDQLIGRESSGAKPSAPPATPSSGNNNSAAQQQPQPPSTTTRFSSRFREKPKLKRGQTVDSVFRIPLIPSSPLKHAQQHQQTPTAHLDNHELITIEDDERSSLGSGGTGQDHMQSSRKRSSSTRSRSGSRSQSNTRLQHSPGEQQQQHHSPPDRSAAHNQLTSNTNNSSAANKSLESSFEADDASDLLNNNNNNSNGNQNRPTSRSSNNKTTPNQIVRQSSLSTLSSTITRTEQKRQRALWDLFQSECTFFFDHLMTLKNVYMEPLKKIQVEGFAMFADPDVLFGNLDELCCGVYDFCKEFLLIIMRTLKTRPEELNATDVLIKLYKKNPKIDHLRAVYHRYTLNYINALTYLESLRRQVEFVEFEKWSSRDVRCKKLQLTDLLVAPVQHIMRVPIILKDIESHTENTKDRDEIRAILAVEEASLRELDDKMRWLKNFERLLEIQKSISWPSVLDMEPKLFVPEFLKEVFSKQPCEKLIVSPRRQIVHEGTLSNIDLGGKACDLHVILFDDMLLMTRKKKGLTKKASTVCKTNSSSGNSVKDDGSFKYIVYKQPLSLDRFYVHDVQQPDAQAIGFKHLFLFIVMNRFQQIINVHSFSAPNDDVKQTWLFKIKKTADRWKRNFSGNSNEQHQQAASGGAATATVVQPTVQQQHQQHANNPDQMQHHNRTVATAAAATLQRANVSGQHQNQSSGGQNVGANQWSAATNSKQQFARTMHNPQVTVESVRCESDPRWSLADEQPGGGDRVASASPYKARKQPDQQHQHRAMHNNLRGPTAASGNQQAIELIITSASESPNDLSCGHSSTAATTSRIQTH